MPWNNRCPPWALPRTRPSAVPTTSASPRLWESPGLALARAEDPQRAMADIVATDKARTRNAVGRCRADKDIALLLHLAGGRRLGCRPMVVSTAIVATSCRVRSPE